MAFTISQMVGGTKADGGEELSARGFKIFVLIPVTPVERMSTHVYSCRQEVDPVAVIGSILLKIGIKTLQSIF